MRKSPPIGLTATDLSRRQIAAGKELDRKMRELQEDMMSDFIKGIKDEPTLTVSGDTLHLLIDGDIIAYRSAAATDGKSYNHDGTNFKYHKDLKKHCDKYGLKIEDAKVQYNTEPLAFATANMDRVLKASMNDIQTKTGRPVEMVVYLTSDVLFRDAFSPGYKGSRKGTRRPTNLAGCKAHLEKAYGAETIEGYEADDLMSIMWHQGNPEDSVIVTLDKDLRQCHGQHYDFTKNVLYTVSIQEARVNFWTQALVGDKVDDIDGLFGVGPVTAGKILKDLNHRSSNWDYYDTVVNAYLMKTKAKEGQSKEDFIQETIERVNRNCSLLWLCREPDEFFIPPTPPPKSFGFKVSKEDMEKLPSSPEMVEAQAAVDAEVMAAIIRGADPPVSLTGDKVVEAIGTGRLEAARKWVMEVVGTPDEVDAEVNLEATRVAIAREKATKAACEYAQSLDWGDKDDS